MRLSLNYIPIVILRLGINCNKEFAMHRSVLIVLAVLGFAASFAKAEPDIEARLQALQDTVSLQQKEIENLRGQVGSDWLNDRRAEEIKTLIGEVLEDADTRASLMADGATAGFDHHFFIASNDGTFLLQTSFKLQTRYISNNSEQPVGTDEHENGFQQRRTEISFEGHVYDPRLSFKVKFEASRSSGDVGADDIYVNYKLDDIWQVRLGQFKAPFLREFLVSSGRQQAVERSFVNNVFNVNRSQGAQLSGKWDCLSLAVMLHDGANAKNLDFNADRTEIAFAARAELLLAGNWKQFKDFAAWSNEPFALLVGGAVDYEDGEDGDAGAGQPDVFEWTLDASAEFSGINVFAAIIGQHVIDSDGNPAAAEIEQYGLVLQGGVFVVPDKLDAFVRYEYINADSMLYNGRGAGGFTALTDESISIVTFGGNYYIRKHNIKASLDVVWALDQLPIDNTGAGLLISDGDQIVIRAQLQVYF